jgi:hypothetical protein
LRADQLKASHLPVAAHRFAGKIFSIGQRSPACAGHRGARLMKE